MMRTQFEGALYFASVYAACVVYSRARSIRRARTIQGNTVFMLNEHRVMTDFENIIFWLVGSIFHLCSATQKGVLKLLHKVPFYHKHT